MKRISLPVGATTAIGSLPHRHVDAAVSVALAAGPDLPAAPTLPRLDPRQGMLAQAAWGLSGVDVDDHGVLHLTGRLDPELPFGDEPSLTGPAWASLDPFLDAVSQRIDPIKLQVTGPITLGLALLHAGADATTAFATAGAAVRTRAHQVVARAMAHAPGTPLYVFIDEPGLGAMHDPSFPLRADEAIDLVSGALASLESMAVTGLHCCGRADWRLALAAGPQILSFPISAEPEVHAGAFSVHLERGGWLAWGVVPTSGPISDSTGVLWRRLSETWCELVQRGCDPIRLREQALVTPECGLAAFDPVYAEQLLVHAADLAERVRRQSFGARLAVGA